MNDLFSGIRREREIKEERDSKEAEAKEALNASREQICEARDKYKCIVEPILEDFAKAVSSTIGSMVWVAYSRGIFFFILGLIQMHVRWDFNVLGTFFIAVKLNGKKGVYGQGFHRTSWLKH